MHTVVSPALESIFIPLQATASLHSSGKSYEKKGNGEAIISATKMISDNNRIVILGDPGSGKTTLLRYLVVNYARLLRNDRLEGDKPDIIRRHLGISSLTSLASYNMFGESPLPIYLSFRSITAQQVSKSNFKLEDIVFGRYLSCPKGYLDEKLHSGKCIVFLDGLDEVPSSDRREVVEWVDDLVCSYPDNKYIVTSRVVGYTNPLVNGFVTYKLEDFSDKDIESFIKQWYLAVETSTGKLLIDKEKTLEQANDLIETIFDSNQVRLLAVNPLLLSIIALVHRYRARLPEKRVDLYDECTIVLLGYWDQAKGLFGKLQPTQKRAILEAVAYEMQIKKIQEITNDELIAILDSELPKYGGNYQDTIHFLDEVKERSGILVERGANVFSFSHLTFQEYLVARCLTRTNNSVDVILENVRDDQWQEVLLLFCGMQDPSLLIRQILEFQDDIFYSWTILAGQCVADALFVSEALRKEMLNKLIELALKTEFTPCRVSAMRICSKIDSTELLSAIEKEFYQSEKLNPDIVLDSFSLLIDSFPDKLCMDYLSNNDLRLDFLKILPRKKEISDKLFDFIVEKISEFNAEDKVAAIRIIGNNPRPNGLDILNQILIYDESDDIRSRSVWAIGKHNDPRVFSMLGLSILDNSGSVIVEIMSSLISLLNAKSDEELWRYGFVSSYALLKELFNKKNRAQASLSLVGGIGLWIGILLIRSSKFLKLNLRDKNEDKIAIFAWSIYSGIFKTLTMFGRGLLFNVISRDELNFWTAYYQSIMAYSIDDPRSSEPFKPYLQSLPKRHVDFLQANLHLLRDDFEFIEKLIDISISKIVSMDDLWALTRAMERIGDSNHELALSIASRMVLSQVMPIRGEGFYTLYYLRRFINKEHISIFANTAKDEAREIREMTAWAILDVEELRTKELILPLLGDKDAGVLVEILDTIGQLGTTDYIENIRGLLLHEHKNVRNAAYNSLWKISKKNKIIIV